jgi:hypothetical protein
MCAGGGCATTKFVNISEKFTLATEGLAPYAQQIVHEPLVRRRKFFA